MNNITLNPDQQKQNALDLLKKRCKEVELYLNSGNQKEAMRVFSKIKKSLR
jgi:hypothetical protein